MMASPSELSLDCKPHGYSMLLKSMGEQQHQSNGHDQTQKLEEFVSRLEEERLKIDAFKRELPLCMQLLTNAMETSKQQLYTYRANSNLGSRPVLEEFIPLKNSNNENHEKTSILNMSDNKATWMTSAQLWSQATTTTTTTTMPDNININHSKNTQNSTISQNENDINFNNKLKNDGAFLPFSKERHSSCTNPSLQVIPELALASGEKDEENKNYIKGGNCNIGGGGNDVSDAQTTTTAATTSSQTHRKTRRCWSPDLHRRFVNALQMLGGSQVATPKQIRELMKVDGLTNDEVKSHLQKYRLHTRRPSPSPQSAGNAPPQLVVLGGIWVPPEYATAAGAQTLYGNQHYCTPQDFYTGPPPPPQHHQQLLHHIYNPSSQTNQNSPDSTGRGGTTTTTGGNRSESIEDGKSESGGSWKAESGGDGKALALREECEGSNGSEITLKF